MTLLLLGPEVGEQGAPPAPSAARLRTLTGAGTVLALFLFLLLGVV